MKSCALAVLAALASAVCSSRLSAEVYRVGPGETHKSAAKVAGMLGPGDVVEIAGDIRESIELFKNGAAGRPITIRGVTRVEEGKIIRPKITFPEKAPFAIKCAGDHYVIEGLDISGALGTSFETGSAIYYTGDNLTVRNCYIHGNREGIYGDFRTSGNIFIEFCEFESNGGADAGGANMHTIYLNSTKPGATAILQHCFLHDATGATLFKSRCPRNVVRYNWFEDPLSASVYIVDAAGPAGNQTESLYPMHSDIVANVFFAGWSPWLRWKAIQVGGEGVGAAGTEGDFNIAHNLFITTNNAAEPSTPIVANGNIDRIRVYNNVFVPYGVAHMAAYERGVVWGDDIRTKAFAERRGGGEPVLEGAGNWVSERATYVPEVWKDALRGFNPRFVDMLNGDFRPRKDSPLAGAGIVPLPKGAIIDLVPEYEPERGIPADLKPTARRKVTPPSIGPFEVAE